LSSRLLATNKISQKIVVY